jgi:hypothetical protein
VIAARFDDRVVRWKFSRGAESVELDRVAATEIIVTFSGAAPQVMRFADIVESVLFQTDLETELVRTGWTLTDFQSTRVDDPFQSEPLGRALVAVKGTA